MWSAEILSTWASPLARRQVLVVPVIDADQMSFAGIEKAIAASKSATANSPRPHAGRYVHASPNGVHGSLMSSPILNPPQSGILGMHKIQDRPMAINGEVVIRLMMYAPVSTTTASSTAKAL
jgi:2-oxoglutarate dehydrogenase E2 component (dihydrolipoamide succinyltransferase)